MKRINKDCLKVLIFSGIFAFANGIFANYQELWLTENEFTASSISTIIALASIITVLVFLYLSVRITPDKLKKGMEILVILETLISGGLYLLNNTGNLFLIKFFIFFYVAFGEFILSSIYPLITNITKDENIYVKKGTIVSLANKSTLLLGIFLIGKTIFRNAVTYNLFLFVGIIFLFISFYILHSIKINSNKEEQTYINIKSCLKYFNNNKIYYLSIFQTFLSNLCWYSIIGLKMLIFTDILKINPNYASLFILGLGIISSLLSLLVVGSLRFKDDRYNLIIKYGIRVILYFLMIVFNNNYIFLITLAYMMITEDGYGYIFGSYFSNKIKKDYLLMYETIKYSFSMIGYGIGVLICGLIINCSVRTKGITIFIISLILYTTSIILLQKRNKLK